MKRLKFKKPFNGMDNAKKLIPESYKVDGKEFEITDGVETYRVKWESDLNEATVLTSSNKTQINEDMNKMKHLMGFKSQDTLGTVKGAARLEENKTFNTILGKTKKLLKEEVNEMKSGMGGSNNGKSRTDKTEVLKKDSKKKRRKADKKASAEITEEMESVHRRATEFRKKSSQRDLPMAGSVCGNYVDVVRDYMISIGKPKAAITQMTDEEIDGLVAAAEQFDKNCGGSTNLDENRG